ncbi:MAG: 7-cyano-7-deazaguanine synthase QueC [Sandaracinus sp.]|nr:7-cyano-7-deazaguanine synthase QueC [Sandaracinus sp.]
MVLLLSGGLDSTTLLADLSARGVRVHALTFEYGQRHVQEVEAARWLASEYGCVRHDVVRLELWPREASTLLAGGEPTQTYDDNLPMGQVGAYVPMRNLVFLAQGVAIAEATGVERVLVGFNREDAANFWDCAPAFVDGLNTVLGLSTASRVRVEAPLAEFAKAEVVRRAEALGVPVERTVTCYSPGPAGAACGRCLACRILERARVGSRKARHR